MRRPPLSASVIALGLSVLALGAAVWLWPWFEAARWQAAPEAARAQRNAEAPAPIWVTPTPPARPEPRAVGTQAPVAVRRAPPLPMPTATSAPFALLINVAPALTPTPVASDLLLSAAVFEFIDPPEPGAAARLTVSVQNPTDRSVGPVSLSLPLSWFSGYRIESIQPPLTDAAQGQLDLRLSFAGPSPQSDTDVSIDVVAIEEVIDAPALAVFDADGRLVGRTRPTTQAPPARPGPIYSIDIPRLKLHTGVVPVEWEPPLFVVGQVKDSAFVSLGNSVLVGHVHGAPGYNVFDQLDQLTPGDEVVASSRGQPYSFIVTQTEVLPEDDTSPTLPTTSPRLTLMTCAGDWNPLTRDYPDRLWVIAEPDPEATQPPWLAPRRLRGLQ